MLHTITILFLNLYNQLDNQLGRKQLKVSQYPWEIFNPQVQFSDSLLFSKSFKFKSVMDVQYNLRKKEKEHKKAALIKVGSVE